MKSKSKLILISCLSLIFLAFAPADDGTTDILSMAGDLFSSPVVTSYVPGAAAVGVFLKSFRDKKKPSRAEPRVVALEDAYGRAAKRISRLEQAFIDLGVEELADRIIKEHYNEDT